MDNPDAPLPPHHPQIVAMREDAERLATVERTRADERLASLEVVVQRAIEAAGVKVAHHVPCARNIEERGGACAVCDANDAHAALHAALQKAGLVS